VSLHFDARDSVLGRLLGRTKSLFACDMATHADRLADAVRGRRLLIVGGAGSIGAAFVKAVIPYGPAAVHVVDINENELVEVTRDFRSSRRPPSLDFRTATLDLTDDGFLRFVAAHAPYDVFCNFAALKHVRAERDVFSLMRMIEVNVAGLDRCLANSRDYGFQRVFSVSTDKSVRPANLMGATKNLMEKVLFCRPGAFVATSARFANVAFSGGSLLEGFERRLAKGQPLAGPDDIRRYFISHAEAAQLCLLACFLGGDREVFFPKLDPKRDLLSFPEIATALLQANGLKPLFCATEDEARQAAVPAGSWPCHFVPTRTSGEKTEEEFFRHDDILDTASFEAAGISREKAASRQVIDRFLSAIAGIRTAATWQKQEVVAALHAAVPEMLHVERGRDLDQSM
jgi:FlaA1/EpsC-like NDP-sugar epimerase